MIVYKHIIIDMRSLEDIELECFDYRGPVALCGGGGKGGGTESSAALSQIAKKMFKETTPLRQEYTGQMESLLKTGGIGAAMPMISKSVEKTRQATSTAMTGLDERMAMLGLSGTPFGEGIRAEQAQAGEQKAAGIGPEFYKNLLPSILNLILGQGQTVVSGLGGAASAEASTYGSEMAMWSRLIPDLSISKAL